MTPIWTPAPSRVAASAMAAFQTKARQISGRPLDDYAALHRWSVDEPEAFWGALADFTGMLFDDEPTAVMEPPPAGRIRGGAFFPGATLNFARNLLEQGDAGDICLRSFVDGADQSRSMTRGELRRQAGACARALQQAGVQQGDRVAGVLANGPEAIVAMLGAACLGAVWSSCSPDFGAGGVLDRLGQVDPKVVFFSTAYRYGGKDFNCGPMIRETLDKLPTVVLAVGVPCPLAGQGDSDLVDWQSFLDQGGDGLPPWTPVPFDHPLYIMFSSGTTGVPKCIIHGTGGTLLQHKKELLLHCDLGPGQRLFYFTTCGWMMWNWMVSGLSTGAGLVLYDGNPAFPGPGVLWDIVAAEKVTVFGTSPKYMSACMNAGYRPPQGFAPRTVLSTGAPLLPEHYDWLYDRAFPGKDVHLASISGGTDLISCFMLGNPLTPVYRGEIQGPGLGMAVDAFDGEGRSLRGEKGELVCTRPFVSMPVGFHNDPDGSRYGAAYFEFYDSPEVWRHGDYIEITGRDGIIVYGRSDATLNPGGVRIGTAEIYRQVEALDEVDDSIAVGQRHEGDTRIVLFLKLAAGKALDAALEKRIRSCIRSELTPRHVPAVILAVDDIPYTRSGKKLEIAVTRAVHGEDIPNRSAIANPGCLQQYYKLVPARS